MLISLYRSDDEVESSTIHESNSSQEFNSLAVGLGTSWPFTKEVSLLEGNNERGDG